MYNRLRRCCCRNSNYMNYSYNNEDVETISESAVESSDDYIDEDDECMCGYNRSESIFPENAVLGQSYVPIQKMDKTFIPCVGLKKGTLFPELIFPYSPCQSIEECAFIKSMNQPGKGCNKC